MQFQVPIPQFRSGSGVVVVDLWADAGSLSWRVARVKEVPADKRRKPITHDVDRNDYNFRRMSIEERQAYHLQLMKGILGEEGYKDALRQAWMMAMPEELKESTPTEKEA